MSTSINFHGPYTYRSYHYAPGDVPLHPEPYSSLDIDDGHGSYITLYFAGPDGLDALIAAALAARDQWAPAPPPLDVPGDLGAIPANRIGAPAPVPERPLATPPRWDTDGTPANSAAAELDAAEADPGAHVPAPQCLTCGATTNLEPVHVRAREGIAARTEYYCRDTAACHDRRHPELASLVGHAVTPEPHPDDCACAGLGVCEYWNHVPSDARAE